MGPIGQQAKWAAHRALDAVGLTARPEADLDELGCALRLILADRTEHPAYREARDALEAAIETVGAMNAGEFREAAWHSRRAQSRADDACELARRVPA